MLFEISEIVLTHQTVEFFVKVVLGPELMLFEFFYELKVGGVSLYHSVFLLFFSEEPLVFSELLLLLVVELGLEKLRIILDIRNFFQA